MNRKNGRGCSAPTPTKYPQWCWPSFFFWSVIVLRFENNSCYSSVHRIQLHCTRTGVRYDDQILCSTGGYQGSHRIQEWLADNFHDHIPLQIFLWLESLGPQCLISTCSPTLTMTRWTPPLGTYMNNKPPDVSIQSLPNPSPRNGFIGNLFLFLLACDWNWDEDSDDTSHEPIKIQYVDFLNTKTSYN